MRRIALVRHARALDRELWHHPDDYRPLVEAGFRQADAIAKGLRRLPIDRVISSRAYRCVDTVWPLAEALGLSVARHEALYVGASAADALALMRRVSGRNVVLCTHGDVIQDVLEHLDDDGVDLDRGIRLAKGSYWMLEVDDRGEIRTGSYHPAPRA